MSSGVNAAPMPATTNQPAQSTPLPDYSSQIKPGQQAPGPTQQQQPNTGDPATNGQAPRPVSNAPIIPAKVLPPAQEKPAEEKKEEEKSGPVAKPGGPTTMGETVDLMNGHPLTEIRKLEKKGNYEYDQNLQNRREVESVPDQDPGGPKVSVHIAGHDLYDVAAWRPYSKKTEHSETEIAVLQSSANWGAAYQDGNVIAKAEIEANLVKASQKVKGEWGIVGTEAEVVGKVGANASANASIGKDGLHAGAETFAGAEIEGKMAADVGGVGAEAGGSLKAGVGAEAKATIGKTPDGKYEVGFKVGATLGIGADLSLGVTIDPKKVTDTAKKAVDVTKKAGSAVANVGKKAYNKLKFW